MRGLRDSRAQVGWSKPDTMSGYVFNKPVREIAFSPDESNLQTKTSAMRCLAMCDFYHTDEQDVSGLATLLSSDDKSLRFAASVSLSTILGDKLPSELVEPVSDLIAAPPQIDNVFVEEIANQIALASSPHNLASSKGLRIETSLGFLSPRIPRATAAARHGRNMNTVRANWSILIKNQRENFTRKFG
jgi:hypothetical protein